MCDKKKRKVITYNFKKDLESNKNPESLENNYVVDLRKSHIEKMIDDLASLSEENEDLMEG